MGGEQVAGGMAGGLRMGCPPRALPYFPQILTGSLPFSQNYGRECTELQPLLFLSGAILSRWRSSALRRQPSSSFRSRSCWQVRTFVLR